jgi:hypothetical protein
MQTCATHETSHCCRALHGVTENALLAQQTMRTHRLEVLVCATTLMLAPSSMLRIPTIAAAAKSDVWHRWDNSIMQYPN